MKQSSLRVLGCAIMMATMLAGCRGTGEMRYMDLREKPPMVQVTDIEPVKIAIEPFDDRRADKTRVGTRTHLWGGTTVFDVAGDRPGGVITQGLADRLTNPRVARTGLECTCGPGWICRGCRHCHQWPGAGFFHDGEEPGVFHRD